MGSYPTGRRRVLAALGAGLAAFAVGGCASPAAATGRPARIACISGAEELHAALLLGVDPVLAATGPGDMVVAEFDYHLEQIPRPAPTDTAALAAALADTAPDVVLHTTAPPPGIPGAVLVDPALPVDDQLLALGTVLQRTAEAEQAIAGHGYAAGQVATVVQESVLAGATVALVAPGPDGPVLYDGTSPAGAALLAAGVGALAADLAQAGEADFWLRVTGTRTSGVPAERAAWVGPEFLMQTALTRLARLRQIDRLSRWFSGVPR